MIQTKRQGTWLEMIIPLEWYGKTIEDVFKVILKAPKKMTHFFRMEKMVMVNHSPANWTVPLQKGDRVAIKFFDEQSDVVTPTYLDVNVLYEDDHLLVINKPAGIDTHPNSPDQANALLNGVAYYLEANGEFPWVRHIHRLDRDTTGAILFAKHPFVAAQLDGMLEQRQIKRTYLALVKGLLKNKKGMINEPIGRDRHHATRRRVSPTGQTAITHYELIEKYPSKDCTFIKCWLDTGRTHQIRVHFSHIGYPLLGDVLYGGDSSFGRAVTIRRQALHAVKLEFEHPITFEKISCVAPLLDDPRIFPEFKLDSI